MPSTAFRPAESFTSDDLSVLFSRAYAGYYLPSRVDAAGFDSMVVEHDIDLSASRVALVRREPIAFALLGVRGDRGWIGGMGVVPEHRGRGTGLAVMNAVLGAARPRKLRRIDLEVLTQNAPAIQIYEALGFQRRRTLDLWVRQSDATFPLPPSDTVKALDVDECLARFDELHEVAPPWQRDLPTLRRMAGALHALGITDGDLIMSYALYRMEGARVRTVDVAAAAGRRMAMIESILRALIRDRAGSPLHFVNLPQDDPASTVMHRIGAEVEMQQHEMTLVLDE
jgi:ribosomal protein S18 acetylase RimI-like enzyme